MADLPTFDDKKTYMLSGKTLNQIIAAIKAATILSADGLTMEKTPDGIRLKKI